MKPVSMREFKRARAMTLNNFNRWLKYELYEAAVQEAYEIQQRDVIAEAEIAGGLLSNRIMVAREVVQDTDGLNPAGIEAVVRAAVDDEGHLILFRQDGSLGTFVNVGHDVAAGMELGDALDPQAGGLEGLAGITGLPLFEPAAVLRDAIDVAVCRETLTLWSISSGKLGEK